MQYWLDKLTDLAAIPGDEHMVKQALGTTVAESMGFGGYAYLNKQPSHTSALSNYHPESQAEYFRRRFNKLTPSSSARRH